MGLSVTVRGSAAIVVALRWEAIPIAKNLGLLKEAVRDGVTCYRGVGKRILLLQTGMGAEGAARAMLALASFEKVAVLLSSGFCGGVGSEVCVGDLVIGSRVMGNDGTFTVDPSLLESATGVLRVASLSFHTGTILTVGRVFPPTGVRVERWREAGVLAIDMESAYLAAWAQRQGIAFLVIRAVSDTPSEPWAAEAGRFIKEDGRLKVGALFGHLLRHPLWISRMVPLARKLQHSADHLARGIQAFLRETEIAGDD